MTEQNLKCHQVEQTENRPLCLLGSLENELTAETGRRSRIWLAGIPIVGHAGRNIEPGIASRRGRKLEYTVVQPARVKRLLLE